jgi:uncharacterized membrane protein
MMRTKELAANLYLANAVVLITHEIDSAYWHEWELFNLPGGIQLFLILHIGLVGLVLYGYRLVILWGRAAKLCSYVLASSGILAVLIHGIFLLMGAPQFRSHISLILLAATLFLALAQIVVVSTSNPRPGRRRGS